MGTDLNAGLSESELQKISSAVNDTAQDQQFSSPLDPNSASSHSFDLAIEQQTASVHQKTGAGVLYPRSPLEYDGVQLNFCKSPTCPNFGIPIEQTSTKGRPTQKNPNRYKIIASGKGLPMAHCNACNESFSLKSNQGMVEERNRMRPNSPTEASCPHEDCTQHGLGVSAGKPFYSSFGTSAIGSRRWKCMACKRTFSVAAKSTSRQRETHKNRIIFDLLMNKMPLRRIAEVAQVGPQTIYHKIDFIWRQCVAFAADREAKLPDMEIPRLYIGVDKQDYAINWTLREDKRNVVLSAVSFVDNGTGYALGTWLNFDPAVNPSQVNSWACNGLDAAFPAAFRLHARLWTALDYARSVKASARDCAGESTLESEIMARYARAASRLGTESAEDLDAEDQLPDRGMQVHTEYLLYGAFLRMREMLKSTEKVRFFLDQDSGMRSACLGAWADRVKDRTCDAFYVSIAKEKTVDQKRRLAAEAREEIEKTMTTLGCSRRDAVLAVLRDRIKAARTFGKWNDRWVFHPSATMSEPEKALCHLTDFGDLDADHLAWLYNKASLHGVDSYFNRVRRRISILERGIGSQGNGGRIWNGYAAYNPEQIQKLLDIFRVCHNYMWTRDVIVQSHTGAKGSKTKKTPAMLLGLAKGVVTFEDVIYFRA
jgi:transposase-like protein